MPVLDWMTKNDFLKSLAVVASKGKCEENVPDLLQKLISLKTFLRKRSL